MEGDKDLRGQEGRAAQRGRKMSPLHSPRKPVPTGMVLDDISKNLTCVPVDQCPCKIGGVTYAPGQVTADACRTW